MEERLYTKKEVIKLTKEAVGLWRDSYHNQKLYRSAKYFGKWIKERLNTI